MNDSMDWIDKTTDLLNWYNHLLVKYLGEVSSDKAFLLEYIESLKENIHHSEDEVYIQKVVSDIEKTYHDYDKNLSLNKILTPIFNSLPNLCKDLSKNNVKVSFAGSQLKVTPEKRGY